MVKEAYEIAVEKFLDSWEHKRDVVGALICGSYVTGNPSKHSDIDLQILLDKNVKWRERGNKIVDGFLIEYFSNPLPQNFKYFEEDFKKRRTVGIHMFKTGKVVFDKSGDVALMVKEANKWAKKNFVKSKKTENEFYKYIIWDLQDNLQEVYDAKGDEFYFVYYNSLNVLFSDYSHFLGFVTINPNKQKRFLENERDKKKYHVKDFPDKIFAKLYVQALGLSQKDKMMQAFNQLVKHVHKKMGGFNIDGWKVRTKVKV